jgi:hypothetical protein
VRRHTYGNEAFEGIVGELNTKKIGTGMWVLWWVRGARPLILSCGGRGSSLQAAKFKYKYY